MLTKFVRKINKNKSASVFRLRVNHLMFLRMLQVMTFFFFSNLFNLIMSKSSKIYVKLEATNTLAYTFCVFEEFKSDLTCIQLEYIKRIEAISEMRRNSILIRSSGSSYNYHVKGKKKRLSF